MGNKELDSIKQEIKYLKTIINQEKDINLTFRRYFKYLKIS